MAISSRMIICSRARCCIPVAAAKERRISWCCCSRFAKAQWLHFAWPEIAKCWHLLRCQRARRYKAKCREQMLPPRRLTPEPCLTPCTSKIEHMQSRVFVPVYVPVTIRTVQPHTAHHIASRSPYGIKECTYGAMAAG